MTLIASMLLFSSTTYATESVNHKTHMVQKQPMTKQDMQAVFGTQHVKASSLGHGEMVKTEGEWFQFFLPFIVGILGGLAGHTLADESGYLHPGFHHGVAR